MCLDADLEWSNLFIVKSSKPENYVLFPSTYLTAFCVNMPISQVNCEGLKLGTYVYSPEISSPFRYMGSRESVLLWSQ